MDAEDDLVLAARAEGMEVSRPAEAELCRGGAPDALRVLRCARCGGAVVRVPEDDEEGRPQAAAVRCANHSCGARALFVLYLNRHPVLEVGQRVVRPGLVDTAATICGERREYVLVVARV